MKNKELIEIIEEMAAKLGLSDIETKGLNNKQLVKLVSDLKAKAKDAGLETAADQAEPKAKAPAKKATRAVKAAEYKVAKGKSVCCGKRGTIDAGQPIKVEDLGGGQKAMDSLVERKVVLKKG